MFFPSRRKNRQRQSSQRGASTGRCRKASHRPRLEALEDRIAPATRIWDGAPDIGGASANANWRTATNWVGDVAPVAGDDLRFPTGAAQLTNTNDFLAGTTFNSITLTGTAGDTPFVLGGNGITLGAGGITDSTTGAGASNQINFSIALSAIRTFTVSTAGRTLILDDTGSISGAGVLTKAGAGTLQMSGTVANTYTGTTTVSAGTLLLSKTGANAIGGGSLIIGDGFGGVNADVGVLGQSNQIADTVSVRVTSSGRFDLNNKVETIAGLVITGGNVVNTGGTAGSSLTVGSLTMTGGSIGMGLGSLILNGNVTTNVAATTATISGNLSLGGGTRTFTVANGTPPIDLDISAAIQAGGVVKSGAGTLQYSGTAANTYVGDTTIAQGPLLLNKGTGTGGISAIAGGSLIIGNLTFLNVAVGVLGQSNQIADTVNVTVNPLGIFDVNNRVETIGALTVNQGNVVNTGGTAASLLTVNSLTLTIGYLSSFGSPGSVVAMGAGSLNLNGNVDLVPIEPPLPVTPTLASISGNLNLGAVTRTFNVFDSTASTDLTVSAVVSGAPGVGLIKTGFGTMALSGAGANTYTGLTTVSQGRLNIQKGSALGSTAAGTVVASGAALELQGTFTVGAELLTLNGSGPDGTGALRNVSGSNTWNGDITLASASTITISAFTALAVNGNIDNGGFLLTVTGSGTTIFDGVGAITGTGGLTKTGTGILQLSGTGVNTYSGTTTVSAGTLLLGKSVANGAIAGALSIGSTATPAAVSLSISNQIADTSAVTVNSNGSLNLNFSSDTIGSLAGNGSVNFLGSGTLTVGGNNTSTAFSGEIRGSGHLTKIGSGTFTLTGVSTYSGGTNVNAGTLLVNTPGSIGAVTVNTGGTIGGTGTVGDIMVNGGTVAPGTSPGILTPAPRPFSAAAAP